jgi:hypothetical protein
MNGHHSQHGGSYPGVYSQPPAPIEAPPPGEPPRKRDLFALLDGFPANILIVLGTFFLLLGLTLPGCRRARADDIAAEWWLAEQLMDHDLAVYRRTQERERQAERYQATANPTAVIDAGANEARRAASLIAEEQRLERAHDVAEKRREALEARAAVRGLWGHLWVEWLGRIFLLLGLLITTSQATGLRQKVFVAITVIVLLTSLSGIDLDFDLGSRVRTDNAAPAPLEEPRGIDRTD